MRLLTALLSLLCAANAQAAIVSTDSNITRSATVSSTDTFFRLDPNRSVVVEVSGTGSGTLKATTDYGTLPSTFEGFIPDPDGEATANASWELPKGLSYVGFDVTSGTWVVRVAQPK